MRIPCPQCGGEVHLRDAEGFPACPSCGVALVLDRTGVHPHYLYRPRIAPAQVPSLLRRWADRLAPTPALAADTPRLTYYPFWRYTREGPRRLVPAWATAATAWGDLPLPDAEQVFFDASYAQGARLVEPTVPEEAARVRAFGDASARAGDLVRVPVYEATIRLGGARWDVAVEACSGAVIWPGGAAPQAPGGAGSLGWVLGGAAVMTAAAAAIRPLGLGVVVVAILAGLVYGVLAGIGRRSGA